MKKNKYPRFFVSTGSVKMIWKYVKIDKKYGHMYIIRNGNKDLLGIWAEGSGCESRVKDGSWREIPIEEAVLM